MGYRVRIFFLSLCILALGCKYKTSQNQSMSVAMISSTPSLERQMLDAPYRPVGGDSDYEIVGSDYNHFGTGQQGLLLRGKVATTLDPNDGKSNDFYYMLYNPAIHPARGDKSISCDFHELNQGVQGEPYKIIYVDSSGEGLVRGKSLSMESEQSNGSYPAEPCDFVITALHSRGTIPEDSWGRANLLWQHEVNRMSAERSQSQPTSEPTP